MGGLEIVCREGVLSAEIHGGDGASGRVGRVHGVLLRRKRREESTIVGKLVAINFYHEQFVGLSMLMNNPLIRSVRQGIERAHVEKGSQQRVRRPLTWGMLRGMQGSIASWREGGWALWIGLAPSYGFMLRP